MAQGSIPSPRGPDDRSAFPSSRYPRLAAGRWRDGHQPVQHGPRIRRTAGTVEHRQAGQHPQALCGRGGCRQRHLPDQQLRRQRLAPQTPRRAGPRARTQPRRRGTRTRNRRCRRAQGDRRGLDGPDGRDHGADGLAHPRNRGRDVPRTGRRPEGRRRRRALGRNDQRRRGIRRRRRGRAAGRHALVRNDEFRHRRAHDDGRHLGPFRGLRRNPAKPARRLRRELRGRRTRPAAHRAGLRGRGQRTPDHRQGQCRHPEIP